jgi:hypothetical protein
MKRWIYGFLAVAGCWTAANYYVVAKRRIRRLNASRLQNLLRDYGDGHYPAQSVHPGKRDRCDPGKSGRHQRRTDGGPHYFGACYVVAQVVGLVVATTLGISITQIVNDAKGIASAIVSWVLEIVTDIETDIDQAIDFIAKAIDDTIDALKTAFDTFEGYVVYLLEWVTNFASGIGQDIINWCVGVATDLVNDAKGALTDALNFVVALINDAINALQDGLSWLENTIVAPIVSFFTGIEQWWAQHISSWWDTAYQDVIVPIESALYDAETWAGEAFSWVDRYGNDLGQFVDRFWDNLWSFLTDPLGYTTSVLQVLAGNGTLQWFESEANSAESTFGGMVSDVEEWFTP